MTKPPLCIYFAFSMAVFCISNPHFTPPLYIKKSRLKMAQTAVNKAFPRKLPIFRGVWGATFGFVGVSGGVRYGYVSGTFGAATKLLQTDDTND